MLVKFLQTNKFLRGIIYRLGKARAYDLINKFKHHIKNEDRVIDIGAGVGNVCEILMGDGYHITPLDVQDLSFVPTIKPILYDGEKIPFRDNAFDLALLLTVLHHTPHPEKIVEEAKRVAKRIIIIEEIYANRFQKYVTHFFDSLLNLEFVSHPHSNKTDVAWRALFAKMGLKIVEATYSRYWIVFNQATYYLEK